VALVVLIVVALVGHFLDEPMRRRMERTLNEKMTGYTVRLPRLDFHPLGFSITLHGLKVSQNGHPNPPVADIDVLDASVHWRALLHLRLVADFEIDRPKIHINQPQVMAEASDKVPIEDKGWQQALESIYPLKINEFRVRDLSLTYIDDDPKRPVEIKQANFLATNIRNARSEQGTYPSPIELEAVVFDKGKLRIDGRADFLAEPHVGMKADIDLRNVPLERLKPVAIHANVYVSGGTLAVMQGQVEYGPKVQDIHLRTFRIDEVAVDYVHTAQTAPIEEQRIEKVKATAEQLATEQPQALITVDEFDVRNSTFGFVDETTNPDYRIFVAGTNIEVRGFTNRTDDKPVIIEASGFFNGTGKTRLKCQFLPRQKKPELQVFLQIEEADMKTMNDLFRAYGNFDVVGGHFSLYTELHVKDGKIDGYVKPLFADMNVYDRRQDSEKALFHQLYEAAVGGITVLLENPRDEVATQATLKGEAANPELSTWEIIVNLIRNAFFKAILPGFEQAVRNANARASANPPATSDSPSNTTD
jgi:hypothetical protein